MILRWFHYSQTFVTGCQSLMIHLGLMMWFNWRPDWPIPKKRLNLILLDDYCKRSLMVSVSHHGPVSRHMINCWWMPWLTSLSHVNYPLMVSILGLQNNMGHRVVVQLLINLILANGTPAFLLNMCSFVLINIWNTIDLSVGVIRPSWSFLSIK